ncbi:hypothetical protein GUJ93_ZPchr0007g3194 [Zizania palustris]|uniref:Uncharacterized protein n=1 Tax=Zizania palustris TaxID=103762 RepID=A0A8J5STV0_ZIZPA|nr:hypothetical protein GUJ93_ZPchr0007g3194 [Zizania palustris]
MQKHPPVLTSLASASSTLAKSASEELRAAVGGGRGRGRGGASRMVTCVRSFRDGARAEPATRRGFKGKSLRLRRLHVLSRRLSRRYTRGLGPAGGGALGLRAGRARPGQRSLRPVIDLCEARPGLRGSRLVAEGLGADGGVARGRWSGSVRREKEDEHCGVIWVFAKNSSL